LKAKLEISLSKFSVSAETVSLRAFSTDFDTVNLHRPTVAMRSVANSAAPGSPQHAACAAHHSVAAQVEFESNV
jgi:hypothetical protein